MRYIIFICILLINIDVVAQYSESEISSKYSVVADKILKETSKDSSSWDKMAYLCDSFGPRFSGSKNLENALDWIHSQMKKDGLENVRKEEVMVPHWERGKEYCTMNKPWKHKMPMLGLGGSIATPKEGITAPVLVVSGREELNERKDEAKGKIVVYNMPFKNYGQAVQYRVHGASWAAAYGAVASLIRSVSPKGMNIPHTGSMRYADSIKKIPHAAITMEDAAMLHRMQKRGQAPEITLYMEAQTLPDVLSYNVIGELKGSEKPEEIIVIGGHVDSWDSGMGAHDDASGCISTWEALRIMKKLGLRPKRTIRAVMFANEENGVRGGKEYFDKHKDEKHVLAFEFDSGVFPPGELGFRGPDSLFNILKAMEPVLKKVNNIRVNKGGWGVDISYLTRAGVPSLSLNTDDEGRYFLYHHGPADTVDKIDPKDFNECIAAIAIAVYIYADLP